MDLIRAVILQMKALWNWAKGRTGVEEVNMGKIGHSFKDFH